jgi:hypothetical protein
MQSTKGGDLFLEAGCHCDSVLHNIAQPREDNSSSASAHKRVLPQDEARVIVAPMTVTRVLRSD